MWGTQGTGLQSEIIAGYSTGDPLDISNYSDPSQNFVNYPGSPLNPGHRLIPKTDEDHVPLGAAGTAVPEFDYNFQSILGYNASLGTYFYNEITPQQEQDARDILTLWGNYLGVAFVETPNSGLTIATGDPRVVDPALAATAVAGIEGNGIALVNGYDSWGSSPYGGSWMTVAMHEIGHALGSTTRTTRRRSPS